CPRTGGGGTLGGDQSESVRNLVRMERTDHQWDAGVLPDSRSDTGDRVRAPAPGRRPDEAHPHQLPGSDERLREEVIIITMTRKGVIALSLTLGLVGRASAHRLDEYLQATLIGV